MAALLIGRGAEVDPVESNWNATPLGIASYGQKTQMIELLGSASRDIWELTWAGNAARLRERRVMVEAAGQLIHLFRDGPDYAFILRTGCGACYSSIVPDES